MLDKDISAELTCQLFNYSLDPDQGSHLYEALSYFWGDAHDTEPIFIGKQSFPVTPNLHTALLRLRNLSIKRILWIDAVCIDQVHTTEKQVQIQCMAKIYSNADRVIVWLGEDGEDADDSDQALEHTRTAAENESAGKLHNNQKVMALLQRPWFERIWVSWWVLDTIHRN